MARPSLELQSLVTAARALGDGKLVSLDDAELLALVSLILSDLGRGDIAERLGDRSRDPRPYFDRPLEAFLASPFGGVAFWDAFLECAGAIEDFPTYFKCVCEMHKRRREYDRILSFQPFPTSDQIAPRALLEFGLSDPTALASWLTWRKWLFDLDNRAGQETGYLFEPILAAALGGVPFPATKSPVKRADDPSKGRQVDCVVERDAYEFKIRVTIAASGPGRWKEELSFPVDCRASGVRPILVVLDPTPNPRLTELAGAFRAEGGLVYIGDEAWAHLEGRAGATMAVFLENYVRRPVADIGERMQAPLDMKLSARADGNVSLTFGMPEGDYERLIRRDASDPPETDPQEG
jgi:hypothetical protein